MRHLFLSLISIVFCLSSFSQSKGRMARRIDESTIPKDVLKSDYVLLVKIKLHPQAHGQKMCIW